MMTSLFVLLTFYFASSIKVEEELAKTLDQYVDTYLNYFQHKKILEYNDKILNEENEHKVKETAPDANTTKAEVRTNPDDQDRLNPVNCTKRMRIKGLCDTNKIRTRIVKSDPQRGGNSGGKISSSEKAVNTALGHEYEFSNYNPLPVWSYTGRTGFEFWPQVFPSCGGTSQSPINIDRSLTIYTDFPPLHFHRYGEVNSSTTRLQNTGRTLELEMEDLNEDVGVLMGGPLHGEYVLLQAHFHWGSTNGQGSEHTVDRHRFPLELHMVHITSSLGRGKSAVSPREVKDGLVVVSIHFELSHKPNPSLDLLLDTVDYIKPAGNHTVPPFQGFQLADLIQPVVYSPYFSYKGSLTTPGCNEVVLWIVFDEALSVNKYQLERLRSLWDKEGDSLSDNFRPIQPLNRRRVLYTEQWPAWR